MAASPAGPAEYPPEVPGEKMRRIPFPVDRPESPDVRKKMIVTRPDGSEYDLAASLGLGPARDVAPDEQVRDWHEGVR